VPVSCASKDVAERKRMAVNKVRMRHLLGPLG
jgi:hypothetical protein